MTASLAGGDLPEDVLELAALDEHLLGLDAPLFAEEGRDLRSDGAVRSREGPELDWPSP